MREQENSYHLSQGGMLCDVMGFGKTVQALGDYASNPPAFWDVYNATQRIFSTEGRRILTILCEQP
jgi:SNF2 family DNA or RNA helicase